LVALLAFRGSGMCRMARFRYAIKTPKLSFIGSIMFLCFKSPYSPPRLAPLSKSEFGIAGSSLGSNKVDEKLGEVIDKMINPALSRRYRSALEALSALQNAQETFELDEVISQKALQMWMRTYPQGRIETIEWIDELLEKGLPLLPTVNSVALIGVSAIAIFVGQFPFQQMAVKYLSGSTGGISMIATSIVYGFSYSVVFVPCYQKARESCEIGDWGEMKKSIVIPWLALTLAHAVDVFLSSLIGGLRV
jgi:hypothetical protein